MRTIALLFQKNPEVFVIVLVLFFVVAAGIAWHLLRTPKRPVMSVGGMADRFNRTVGRCGCIVVPPKSDEMKIGHGLIPGIAAALTGLVPESMLNTEKAAQYRLEFFLIAAGANYRLTIRARKGSSMIATTSAVWTLQELETVTSPQLRNKCESVFIAIGNEGERSSGR